MSNQEIALILDPKGEHIEKNKIIDYRALSNEQNQPLIITGDEGCGKTHLIIKWLMEFNRKDSSQQNKA